MIKLGFGYLILMALCFLSVLVMEWYFKLGLFKDLKLVFWFCVIALIAGTITDSWSVWKGFWTYNFTNILNIKIGVLPLESYIFFIVVPLFSVAVWKSTKKIIKL